MLTILGKLALPSLCVAAVTALSASGCTSKVPSADITDAVARATGTTHAIQYRHIGEPVDVGNSTTDMLTVADAVRRALAHSPDVQVALARIRAAEADAKQARLLPNPVLSVVLRWPESGGKPEIEAGLAAEFMAFLTRPGRIDAADNRLRAASADALSEVLDVLSDVQTRYVAVQTNDDLLAVLDDRLRIIDRLLEVARSRLQLGEGTRLDVLSLEAQWVELQTELSERRLERAEDRLQLARLIGEPSGTTDWRVAPWEPHEVPNFPEPVWVWMGLKNRPEVLRQRFELVALGADYRLTRFTPFEGAEVGVDAERADGEWAVGPSGSIPIPLFDLGRARGQKARAALVEARHNLTRTQRQVVEDTRRAHAAFAASRENLNRVRNELVPLAERRLEQAEAQFKGGQTDITGLLQAEEEVRAARTRLVELERRNTEGLIRLQRAVGGSGVMQSATDAPVTPAASASAPGAARSTRANGHATARAASNTSTTSPEEPE